MRGLKIKKGGAVADWKVEQYRNNRTESETSKELYSI